MSTAASPFNTPLETGIRIVILLAQAYPDLLSLDRLVMLDHILVHTRDFGGPASVHPPSPYRVAEPYVRRELVQRSLILFGSRGLLHEIPTAEGFFWQAGEPAAPFVECLTTRYHQLLRARAKWTIENFGAASETQLASAMGERVVSAIGVEVSP
jgi:hypothetical protein